MAATLNPFDMDVDTDALTLAPIPQPLPQEPSCSQPKVVAVTNAPASVMAASTTIPSVTVSLHPLVIMNISEHWTRIRSQEGCKQQGLFLPFYENKNKNQIYT